MTRELQRVQPDAVDQNGEERHADVQAMSNQQDNRHRQDAEHAGFGHAHGHFVEAFRDIHARQADGEQADVGQNIDKAVDERERRIDDVADVAQLMPKATISTKPIAKRAIPGAGRASKPLPSTTSTFAR